MRKRPKTDPGRGVAEPTPPALGIRLIVTSVAVAITVLSVLCVGAVQERNSRRALSAEITLRLLLEARNLALSSAPALLSGLPELTLHPLTKEMQSDQPELTVIEVVDHQGVIQGHPDARLLDTPAVARNDLRDETTSLDLKSGESLRGNAELLLASATVSPPGGPSIGTASVGIRRAYLAKAIAAARRQQFLVLAVALVLGVAATLALMTGLLKPVKALRAGLERIGRGDLDTPIDLRDRTEFGMLGRTVDEMAAKLKAAQAEMVEKERLEHELELARQIQHSLLPKARAVAEQFLIDGAHEAASEVGGDYYDVLPLANGCIGIAVADVAGKGLAGCLAMSMLSALLRAYRNELLSPSEMLERLDERLSENLQRGTFVTMFYGILNPRTAELVFASAGHLPSAVYRSSRRTVEWLPRPGIPLASIRGGAIRRTLRDALIRLEPGDMLLQYTDGVSEAFDETDGKQFDFRRIATTLARQAPQGAEAVLDGFRKELTAWRGRSSRSDDETILVVSREVCVPVAAAVSAQGQEMSPHVARSLQRLRQARERGQRLSLRAELDDLERVPGWVVSRAGLQEISLRERELIATALYEACANIAEHGYGLDPSCEFDLWWVEGTESPTAGAPAALPDPASAAGVPTRPAGATASRSNPGAGIVALRAAPPGYFLIHDQGRPFSLQGWRPPDFRDPAVRRRLRGFGLEIIHRVMSHVVYQPGTPAGNLTLLAFDALGPRREERKAAHA